MARKPTVQPGSIAPRAPASDAVAVRSAAREEAEMRALMLIAHEPSMRRDEDECLERIKMSVGIPQVAEKALYSFKRGDTTIEDISAPMAREIARIWGHLDYGLRILRTTDEKVSIEGVCLDFETGTRVATPDEFEKLIQRKDPTDAKKTVWIVPDERDLRELIQRRGAICVRNSILALIPPHVKEAVKALAHGKVASTAGTSKKDQQQELFKLIGEFKTTFGVNAKMIEAHMKREVKKMDAADFATLTGLFNSIRDGHQKLLDVFPQATGGSTAGEAQGDLGIGNVRGPAD